MNDKDKYVKEYLEGVSLRKIAEKYHISRNNLSKYLKELNIPIRNQKITSRKFYCDENFFEDINTERKAYWLGFMYADGYIQRHTPNNKYIGLSLGIKDKSHIEKFKADLKATYEIKEYMYNGYRKESKHARLLICSSKMFDDLSKWGVVERKTFKVTFPNIPYDLKRHFIRGVFDGDGSIYLDKRCNSLGMHICGNKDLLEGIAKYFSDLNCKTHVIKCRSIFDIHLGHKKAKFALDEMYRDSTIYLDRKYKIYKKYTNMQ